MAKKPTSLRALYKGVEQRKKQIAAERDKLRDLRDEIEEIVQNCDDALEALECALDHLSEQL